MGDVRKYNCTCGYSKELNVGAGLAAFNLRLINKTFPEACEKLKALINDKQDTDYWMDNAIISCPSCKDLMTISRLTINTKSNGSRIYLNNKCNICGCDISVINENDVKCPKCGKNMAFEITGNWD